MIRYKGAKVQLLDLPGIIEGAKDGKGRGRQVIAGILTSFYKFQIYSPRQPRPKKYLSFRLVGWDKIF